MVCGSALTVALLSVLAPRTDFHSCLLSLFSFPFTFLPFLLHLWADCAGSNPLQVQLRQELNSSLQIAEKFTKLYDELLQSYQEKMFNTSSLLKQLNEQFSWVSQLANLTQSEDPFYLQVTTVSRVLAMP